MENMSFKDILRKLSNKYIIATLVFAAIIVFFDQYNIFEQGRSYRKLRKVKKQVEYYDREIEKQEQTLHDLKKDSALLEKVAREQHMMKRDDEVIYILDKKE
jgi:Septum formation initiator